MFLVCPNQTSVKYLPLNFVEVYYGYYFLFSRPCVFYLQAVSWSCNLIL
jgi:hypothetical protein